MSNELHQFFEQEFMCSLFRRVILSSIFSSDQIIFFNIKTLINKQQQMHQKELEVESSRFGETHQEQGKAKVQSQFTSLYKNTLSFIKQKQNHPYFHSFGNQSIHRSCENVEFQLNQLVQNKEGVFYFVEMRLNSFIFQFSIFRANRISPLTNIQTTTQGTFGKIYTIPFLDSEITIKSYPFVGSKISIYLFSDKQVQQVFKEYGIALLSSCLRCGPALLCPFGYDIVLFNNRIEFAMEKCEAISKFGEEEKKTLLRNLAILHQHKIMHLDITPSNIMYSPIFKKLVFIDYGFSTIINEQHGFKTFTSFHGTPEYVSKEMFLLFSVQEKKGYVDLYFNDLVGVQLAIQFLKFQFSEENKLKKQVKETIIEKSESAILYFKSSSGNPSTLQDVDNSEQLEQTYYLLILFFFSAQTQNNQILKKLFQKNRGILLKHYSRKILSFIKTLLPSKFFQQLLLNELMHLKKLDEMKQLLNTIQYQRNWFICSKVICPQLYFIFSCFGYEFKSRVYFIEFNKNSLIKQNLLNIFWSEEYFDKFSSNREVFYSLVFDFLRFDLWHCTLEQKYLIANFFLNFEKVQNIRNKNRDPIQVSFKYILQYCLETWQQHQFTGEKTTKQIQRKNWIFLMLQSLFTQAFILDMDVTKQLELFKDIFTTDKLTFPEDYQIFYFYFNLQRFYEKRYLFSDDLLGKINKSKIKNHFSIMKQKIINKYSKSSCQYQIITAKILYGCFNLKFSNYLNTLFEENINRKTLLGSSLKKIILYSQLESLKKEQNDQKMERVFFKIKNHFANERAIKFYSYFQKFHWKFQLGYYIDPCHFQAFSLFEDLLKTIKDKQALDKLLPILFFPTNLESFCINDPELFLSYGKKLVVACFDDQQLDIHERALYYFLNGINCEKQIFKQAIEVVLFPLFQKYLAYLEKQLESFSQFLQKIPNMEYPKRLTATNMIEQFCKKILFFQDKSSSWFSQLEDIVGKNYWKSLSLFACSEQMQMHQILLRYHYIKLIHFKYFQNELHIYFAYAKLQLSSKPSLPSQFVSKILQQLIQDSDLDFYSIKQKCLKSSFEQKLRSIFIWVWKYCKYRQFYKFYFNQKNIFLMMNILLSENQTYEEAFKFLFEIAQYLGNNPLSYRIAFFNNNIFLLAKSLPKFFEDKNISQYLKHYNWNQRYLLVLNAFSMKQEKDEQKKMIIFKKIVQKIDLIKWASKSFILFLCFEELIDFKELLVKNRRQKKYVLMKYYLYRLSVLRKQVKYSRKKSIDFVKFFRIKKTNDCTFNKMLKKKIKMLNTIEK